MVVGISKFDKEKLDTVIQQSKTTFHTIDIRTAKEKIKMKVNINYHIITTIYACKPFQ